MREQKRILGLTLRAREKVSGENELRKLEGRA